MKKKWGIVEREETVFLIHGYRSNYNAWEKRAMQELLYHYCGVRNVITVDWTKDATTLNYNTAAKKTSSVGKFLAKLIYRMLENDLLRPKDIHIVGHSLGAHIAGHTGHFLQTGGFQDGIDLATSVNHYQIRRITGLDPAGPGFEEGNIVGNIARSSGHRHLEMSDASFVDVIHTSVNGSLKLGMAEKVGNVDFYPNGGSKSFRHVPDCYEIFQILYLGQVKVIPNISDSGECTCKKNLSTNSNCGIFCHRNRTLNVKYTV